jgi:hypothetical protein
MNLNRHKLLLVVLMAAAALPASAQRSRRNSPSSDSGTNANVKLDPRQLSSWNYIVRRNIFNPNRLPDRPTTYVAPPPVERFWLAGTMSYDKGTFAIFDGTQQEYHEIVEVGGKIGSYTLEEIGDGSVKLTAPTNQVVELKLNMEMRRSLEGAWTAVEGSSGGSYAVSAGGGETGYADRGYRRGRRGESGGGGYDSGGSYDYSAPATGVSAPTTSSDPIIARMMAQRAAAMGRSNGGGSPGAGDTGGFQVDGTGPAVIQVVPGDGGNPNGGQVIVVPGQPGNNP